MGGGLIFEAMEIAMAVAVAMVVVMVLVMAMAISRVVLKKVHDVI